MAFTVPNSLPALPAYGLPPNVIRASYALNLIQTDAFQFATSRRKVCNLFQVSPLPAGSEQRVAEFFYYPLPTSTGELRIVLYSEAVDVKISSLTAGVDVTLGGGGAADVHIGNLTGLGSVPQLMRVAVTDRGSGSLTGLFIYEDSLSAGDLP
jgi:hypothetical protein